MLIPTTIKYFVRVQGIHELRLAKYELIAIVCFTFFYFIYSCHFRKPIAIAQEDQLFEGVEQWSSHVRVR